MTEKVWYVQSSCRYRAVQSCATINASSNSETLKRLRQSLKNDRTGKLLKGIVILHGNRDHMQQNKHANFWKSLGGKCGITLLIAQTFHLVTSMFLVPWKNFQSDDTTRKTRWKLNCYRTLHGISLQEALKNMCHASTNVWITKGIMPKNTFSVEL